MKKTLLLSFALATLVPLVAFSAPRDCIYHPLQEIIRSARSEKDIEPWIKDQINFNIDFSCGGSILQLAIIRGNPDILKLLIEKGGVNVKEMIQNDAFPIKGAPRVIPISLFAAFYATRPEILNLFMTHAGDSFYEKDANGQNILWYIEQNPVLRNTDLSDLIVKNLLITDTNAHNKKVQLEREKAENERIAKEKAEKERLEKEAAEKTAKEEAEREKMAERIRAKQQKNAQTPKPNRGFKKSGMIEEEPDNAYKPSKDASIDLQGSDF